jgi:DNA-binding MurR/RpiR family transcriptional regulator
MSTVMESYIDAVTDRIAALKGTVGAAMEEASAAVVQAVQSDHLVYLFGTGHSHMLAEEMHYRAGGPAFTVPILHRSGTYRRADCADLCPLLHCAQRRAVCHLKLRRKRCTTGSGATG